VQKRVLFVDDEPSIRGIFEMLTPFLGEDTTIVTAGSGREALNLFEQGPPFDVIVSDLTMPEMGGAELLARVAQLSPSTARVVLSGDVDELTVAKCLLAAHRYFTKPFDPLALTQAIQSLNRAVDAAPRAEIRKLAGKLDALPTPSEKYLQLMKVLNSSTASIDEIAAIVEADPSLATKVLQAVNSAIFGAGRKIVCISEAVQLIGVQVLRALVLTIHVFDFYQNARLKDEVRQLWNHSTEIARKARQLCLDRRWPIEVAEEAFLCGLLHDVGRLILAATPEATRTALFPQYQFFRDGEGPCPVSRLIEAEAATFLLSLWGLPDSVINTVHGHAAGNPTPVSSPDEPSAAVAIELAHEAPESQDGPDACSRGTARSILLISKNPVLATAIGIQCRRTDQFYMTASTLREAFQTFHDLQFDIALVDPELFPYPADQVEGHLRQVNANTTIRLLSSSTAPASEYLDLFEHAVVVES
jgi:HD-like signal output (HDOD) protein/CheY-like chemotaxis protein